ncbi:MAG: indolepyruvate ferredoxin oxidoreductase [Spirochaetales bacterium]|jgi:indolepyruvate ferredoxin oxidoreductase alpha subunit|nr:indolepyruvate ferredoxin oxidoreductase [Spirochaetales bacterium]
MNQLILLGDEALALAALDGGLSCAYGYPGTPSTEIMEYLEKAQAGRGILARWCSNEKTAYEAALGVSLAGRRTLVTMKHVGLNVAADPFINSALLGIHGGLVLAVADDPGMHSSQDEQDSRFYADFAKIPCLEPRNHQEIYDMTRLAFQLSEQFKVPVMVRMVTRLAHSRAALIPREAEEQRRVSKAPDPRQWMLLPALARQNLAALLESRREFSAFTAAYPGNDLRLTGAEWGVITTGLGGNYFEENLEELSRLAGTPSWLHINAYPVPVEKIRLLAASVKRLVIIEEGEPFVERYLRGLLEIPLSLAGKLTGEVPLIGELNPDNIRPALGLPNRRGLPPESGLPNRPPQLCQGCPHGDSYQALNQARQGFPQSLVTSDIGCYALGASPPYSAIETIVCMGASIGMARGAAEAGFYPVAAVLGDSTFLHSGITALVDAVQAGADMTLLILDNSTVAMTGWQETILPSEKLESLILGLGVDPAHFHKILPLKKNLEENTGIIRKEMEYHGLSVILSVRECIVAAKRRPKGKA